MLLHVLLFLFTFLPCQLSIANTPSSYSHAEQQLSVLDADPVALLDIMTLHINEHCHELSYDERDALIEQLQKIKQRLCWRPGAGLLALPILATYAAGFYVLLKAVDVWATYDLPKWIKEDCAKELFDLEQQCSYNFVNSLLHFAVIAVATYFIEAEYRWTVNGLFEKERTLERKIDELITLLQQ